MTKNEIIGELARGRKVEKIIASGTDLREPEASDLAQIVYLALLEKPEPVIIEGYVKGWLDFYVTRIIMNQWATNHSTFRDLYTKYQRKAVNIDDIKDK